MHRVGAVKRGPGVRGSLCSVLEEATTRHEPDDAVSVRDPGTAVSQSPSVRSMVSGVTSLHSLHSMKYHIKRNAMNDELSDVPTITESIADMEDLQELVCTSPTASLPISRSERQPTVIDNRQHPLAPLPSTTSLDSFDSRLSLSPAFGDLGGCSDVPSIRDDASVASAPSEICLSFRTSRCGSKEEVTMCQQSQRRHGATLPHGSGIGQLLTWRSGAGSRKHKPEPASVPEALSETETYSEKTTGLLPGVGARRSPDRVSGPLQEARLGRLPHPGHPAKRLPQCGCEKQAGF